MHTPHAPRLPEGFTLVEMMAVLCIAAVLAGMAVPLARSLGASMKLSGFANGFLSQLHLARSEAIKRNGPVVVCKSADGVSCSADGGWEQGGIVFHDLDGNGLRDPGEIVVQRLEALPRGFHLRGNQGVTGYVSFAPSGRTRTVTGAFQAGTLTVCRVSTEPGEGRQIVINSLGRPRVQKVMLQRCD